MAAGTLILASSPALAQGFGTTGDLGIRSAQRPSERNPERNPIMGPMPAAIPVQSANLTAHRVQPISIAPIIGRAPNGAPIAGEWRHYRPRRNSLGTDGTLDVLFDAYEGAINVCQTPPMGDLAPANGPLSGSPVPLCNMGDPMIDGSCGNGDTARWWFGPEAFFAGYIQPIIELAGGATSGTVTRLTHGWATGAGFGEPGGCGIIAGELLIAVTIYDSSVGGKIDGTNQPITLGDLEDGFKTGVILNFGQVPQGDGYYFFDIDLGGGFELDLANGDAYEIIYLDGEDDGMGGTTILGLSTSHQAMLWYPKDDEIQGRGNGFLYVDGGADPGDCSTFGIGNGDPNDPNTPFYSSEEGVDFSGAVPCPAALYAMVGFYGGPPTGQAGIINTCGLLFGSDPDGNGCDPFRLTFDDDNTERLRSQFGFTALEPNLSEIQVTGFTGDFMLTSMVAVRTRDNGNVPGTTAKVRVFNYDTSIVNQVGTYLVSTPGGIGNDVENITPAAGTQFVGPAGQFDVRIRYTAVATFTALGFDIWVDQIEVLFN